MDLLLRGQLMEQLSGIVIGGCRIERELGRGGAGTVYRATQLGIGRQVAVKLIPAGSDGTGTAGRFEREAHAAGALDHPHCLPVYAAGEQDGLLYLVMRLVNGPDLARLIDARGPLAPADAVALIEQVATAVDHAHRAGLIHRDLKPANILIEPERDPAASGVGHAYVSDFGLMRSLTDPGITQSGQWVGTPRFAAPEQMRGDEVGPASDIYALGGVLAAALGPEPPAELSAVIIRALDPDPAARYPTAGALAGAARAALESPGQPGGTSSSTPGSTRTPAPARGAVPPPAASQVTARTAAVEQPTNRFTTREDRRADVTAVPQTAVNAPQHGRSRATLAIGLVLVIGAALAAIAVALVLALRHHHAVTPGRPGASTHTTPATTTTGAAGNELVTGAFSATLPASWTTATPSEQLQGYERTIVQSPTGSAEAFIDRSPSPGSTLAAHAQSVETAAARTNGYHKVSFGTTSLDGSPVVVWSFTLTGVSDGQRVDVFREIGRQLFAVLGSSSSLALSESTATGIAASIRLR